MVGGNKGGTVEGGEVRGETGEAGHVGPGKDFGFYFEGMGGPFRLGKQQHLQQLMLSARCPGGNPEAQPGQGSSQGGTACVLCRQHGVLSQQFVELINKCNSMQSEYREKNVERIRRQLKISELWSLAHRAG